jgi:transposase
MANGKIHFKTYQQGQVMAFPPTLEELIDKDHPVRVVSKIIDELDLEPLLKNYKGGGTSSFHPRMMLKIVVFSYLNNVYSSRKMEAAVKENIHFMWLSGMSKPDHNTLNRFRSDRLKGVVKHIFGKVVELLVASEHVSLQQVYTDGTKIEASANRYTFVWGKSIKTSKEKMEAQLKELWAYAESVAREELKDKTPTTFAPISPEHIKETVEKIDEALRDKAVDKKIKQKVNYAKKNWPGNVAKYQQQEQILGDRGSYSKTDPDATFMRMKEDHMKNGQLKPGYNLQISTSNQYIVNYSIHQTTNDVNTLKTHLESHQKLHGALPKTLTADAGYGSEENFELLDSLDIDGYVKYSSFDKEQRRIDQPFKSENFHYNQELDCFYCPMGQPMTRVRESRRKTTTGFEQEIVYYQAQRCYGCPLIGSCHSAKGNRKIEVNHRLRNYKIKMSEKLTSPEGVELRKKRCADVEPVFGNIKNNHGFKRFNLRGLEKVEIETALLAIAQNLRKRAA